MKLKKAKKIESSLVAVLEFVRSAALHEPEATTRILQKMSIDSDTFAPCVNRLVKLAIKTAEEIGSCVQDVLESLRRETAKRQKKCKNPNVYADDSARESADYDDEEEECNEDNE